MLQSKTPRNSGRVDIVSATELVDSARFPVGPNQRLYKLAFTALLLDVQQLKRQCTKPALCVINRWAGGS